MLYEKKYLQLIHNIENLNIDLSFLRVEFDNLDFNESFNKKYYNY